MARKTNGTKQSLKELFDNHPIMIVVGALSIITNFGTGAWSAYAAFFGDRSVIVEEYVQTSIGMAEHSAEYDKYDQKTGKLEPFGCRVVDNEIRKTYTAWQTENKKMSKEQNRTLNVAKYHHLNDGHLSYTS